MPLFDDAALKDVLKSSKKYRTPRRHLRYKKIDTRDSQVSDNAVKLAKEEAKK